MKPIDLATLLLLAAIWGASFLFIRIASPALGPAVLVDVRVLLAGGVLLVYAVLVGAKLDFARWKEYLLLGAVNAALPFTFIAAAELALTASFAAILNATTPVFTTLVAALWTNQPLTRKTMGGLGLGMAGVGVAVGWSPVPATWHVLLAVCSSLAGALCYGIGFVYTSRSFREVPALNLSIMQQLSAGVLLVPIAAAAAPHSWPSGRVVFSVLGLSILATSFAYFLYFRLVRRIGPTSTATVTFLVPLFGLLWSRIFLREPVGPGLFVGMGFILTAVTLVTGMRVRLPARRSKPIAQSRVP
jgi:drug/metabolite transporter (DMT)-like permease